MFPDELTLIEEQAASLEMFGAIDGVLRDPGRYGFTNMTTADHAHAATTALDADEFRFGSHGQAER